MMISKRIHPTSAVLMAIAVSSFGQLSAATIDQLLAQRHQAEGLQPTAVCDDATFLRRLSLDLIGRVPTTDELAAFLQNPNRVAAVDRLLASDEHPVFWSHLWTTMLVGRGQQRGVEREVLRRWVEEKLAADATLNQIAFDLISAEGVTSLKGPVNYVVASRADPVMRLSRTFLSVQLDCARCHDHPHDRWTNDDYKVMQRFFQPAGFREVSGGIAVSDAVGELNENRPVFLTGRKPQTTAWRRELGLMVVQSKPFSRAMVNRTWAWLMGRGLVDPVDGLSRDNPAAVPELLEALADDLRKEDYRLRPLIRRICASQAYQRQPALGITADDESARTLFAVRTTRQMMPEQWISSLALVLDRPPPSPVQLAQQANRLLGITPQANPVSDPYSWVATSQTVIRQLSGPIRAPLRSLDSLYLATLARKPTYAERELVCEYSSQETLFALVHGDEFIMND